MTESAEHERLLNVSLRVVLYRDDDLWIAHCLEFDLVGSDITQQGALDSLRRAVVIQVEQSIQHSNFQNLFQPAESRIWAMFAAGTNPDRPVETGVLNITMQNVVIPDTVTREFLRPDENPKRFRDLQSA